jgi:hypothetical protein
MPARPPIVFHVPAACSCPEIRAGDHLVWYDGPNPHVVLVRHLPATAEQIAEAVAAGRIMPVSDRASSLVPSPPDPARETRVLEFRRQA